MPNIYVGTINATAPGAVAVGVTSGTVVAENLGRVGLTITNLSSGTIYLAFGGLAATLTGGVVLGANGGVFSMDEYSYSNATVNGVAHSANASVAFQEFVR